MRKYLLVVMAVSILVTGCGSRAIPILDPSAPCDQVVHPAILSVSLEELAQGREVAEEWIVTNFPTATVEFHPDNGDGIGTFYFYEDEEEEVDENIYRSKNLFRLYLSDIFLLIEQVPEQDLTLGHILRCFGDPEYYTMERYQAPEAIGVRLEIWYPNRGLKFESVKFYYRGITDVNRYDATSAMYGSITVRPAGTMEEILENDYRGAEEYIQRELELLVEWPDNFTELVFEE